MNKPKDIPFAYMISKLLSLNPHLSSSYPQWNINLCSKSYLCITALLERNVFFFFFLVTDSTVSNTAQIPTESFNILTVSGARTND